MKELATWIKEAHQLVCYTGAGMSTESGLPDFRSKDRGLWEKFNPSELANIDALLHNTAEFTSFYQYRLSEITKYKPHEGHFILGKWETNGVVQSIITQNVDGFHSDAGNENVHELHGSFRTFHCHACGEEQPRTSYLTGDATCAHCAGVVRPGIVLFGEQLPEQPFIRAEQDSAAADLFIVLGSSLSVTPANMFPVIAKENGAKLVIINREPTPYDSFADKVIHDQSIREALISLDEFVMNNR